MTNKEAATEIRNLLKVLKTVLKALEAGRSGDCEGCAFEDRGSWEEPCKMCNRNCKDYYKKAANEIDPTCETREVR